MPPCRGRNSVGGQLRTGMRKIRIFARTANRPALTPEIRQAMGLPDGIHGVPVVEGYPGTHAQAIDPGAGTVPLPWRQVRSSTLPGATCTLSSVWCGYLYPPHRDCRLPRPRPEGLLKRAMLSRHHPRCRNHLCHCRQEGVTTLPGATCTLSFVWCGQLYPPHIDIAG